MKTFTAPFITVTLRRYEDTDLGTPEECLFIDSKGNMSIIEKPIF